VVVVTPDLPVASNAQGRFIEWPARAPTIERQADWCHCVDAQAGAMINGRIADTSADIVSLLGFVGVLNTAPISAAGLGNHARTRPVKHVSRCRPELRR